MNTRPTLITSPFKKPNKTPQPTGSKELSKRRKNSSPFRGPREGMITVQSNIRRDQAEGMIVNQKQQLKSQAVTGREGTNIAAARLQ